MVFSTELPLVLLLSSLLIQASLAEIVCEDLPKDVCAFSIASSGKRCLLETANREDGNVEYQCRTSEAVVERMAGYIETDKCVEACGVERKSVGISSDSLLEPQFTAKLCSPSCYNKCPNIVDLYFNLAAGEGVFLPALCEKQRTHPYRALAELLSSGTALGPVSSESSGMAPASGPASSETGEDLPISPGPGPDSSDSSDDHSMAPAPGPDSSESSDDLPMPPAPGLNSSDSSDDIPMTPTPSPL